MAFLTQIRREYERRAEMKKVLEEQNRIKTKGEIRVCFDAKHMLDTPGLSLEDTPEFSHALVVHSWEVPQQLTQTRLNDKTSLIFTGNVVTQNGLGSGGVTTTCRHIFPDLSWGEVKD